MRTLFLAGIFALFSTLAYGQSSAPFNAYSVQSLGGNCSTQGSILAQGSDGKSFCLAPGATSGQVLSSLGAGSDPIWTTPGALSTNIQAGATPTTTYTANQFVYSDGSHVQAGSFSSDFSFSGGTLNYANIAANSVWCNDTGSSAHPTACTTLPVPVQNNIGLENLKYTAPQSGAVQITQQQKNQDVISVTDFGAVGDSNGTHGNGTDDTAAFQAAFDAAAVGQANTSTYQVFVPCGTYRLTGTINGNAAFPATYYIEGPGACAQIFLDTTVAATAFNFSPTVACGSVGACVAINGLNFITPNVPLGSTAISMNKVQSQALIENNIFQGYTTGVKLVATFGNVIEKNQFFDLLGAGVDCSTDTSCNATKIIDNGFFGGGLTVGTGVVVAGTGSGTSCFDSANNFVFSYNDVEGNYGGPVMQGVCSTELNANFIEANTTWGFFFGGGFNSQATISNNWLNNNGASGSFEIQNVTGLNWAGNTFHNQSLTYGTTLDDGALWGFNRVEGTSTGEHATPTFSTTANMFPGGISVGAGSNITSSGPGGALTANAYSTTTFAPTANPTFTGTINAGDYIGSGSVSAPLHLTNISLPTLSACGTGGSVDAGSSSAAGKINLGSGTAVCTVTFATPYPNNAYCTATAGNIATSSLSYFLTATKTGFTVTFGVSTTSAVLNYTCGGN